MRNKLGLEDLNIQERIEFITEWFPMDSLVVEGPRQVRKVKIGSNKFKIVYCTVVE